MTETAAGTRPSDHADETRAEILRHAEDLFSHYGFSKTSMADIAERCGMSPGNLYRYYRNKQAIGIAVTEVFFRQMEAEIESALAAAAPDPESRIRALLICGLGGMIRKMDCTPKIMELVEFLCGEDEPYAVLYDHITWKRAKVEAELAAGIAAGRFAETPVYETAVNLLHAVKAFQMPQVLALWRNPATIMPEFEGVLELLFRGLRKKD